MGQSRRDKRWPAPGHTRHVWVRVSSVPGQVPVQGLVVDWRRHSYAWSALVVFVLEGAHGPEMVQRWVHAEVLAPVPADPNRAFSRDQAVMRAVRRGAQ